MADVTVTMTSFSDDVLGFQAKRIVDNITNFDPSDVSERIRRAHQYSAKCERMRDEHTARVIEGTVEVLAYAFIFWLIWSLCR